jgi:electron transport complex protein RnfG
MNGVEKSQPKDSVARDVFILVVITLAAGMLLGAAYSVTKGPIAQAQARAKAAAQKAVMQTAEAFEPLPGQEDKAAEDDKNSITNTSVEQIDLALDSSGKTAGYVVTAVNSEGYGGEIEMMCGIAPAEDGALRIEGISFLTLTETAGMGMRAKDEDFTQQFAGKVIRPGEQLQYTKDGASAENEIDAISGCTITTASVTKNVNAALEAVRAALETD